MSEEYSLIYRGIVPVAKSCLGEMRSSPETFKWAKSLFSEEQHEQEYTLLIKINEK